MLDLSIIDTAIKLQQKEQRLANLKIQWFEMYMNKVALEANGRDASAAQKKMDELQTSYDAIEALNVGDAGAAAE